MDVYIPAQEFKSGHYYTMALFGGISSFDHSNIFLCELDDLRISTADCLASIKLTVLVSPYHKQACCLLLEKRGFGTLQTVPCQKSEGLGNVEGLQHA